MDQYLSSIILAIIGGIISIITLVINKKYDKMIVKIDDQALFLDQEKKIKIELAELDKQQRTVIYDMILSTLETNIQILSKVNDGTFNMEEVEKNAEEQRKVYADINSKIADITKQYEMMLSLTSSIKGKMANQ